MEDHPDRIRAKNAEVELASIRLLLREVSDVLRYVAIASASWPNNDIERHANLSELTARCEKASKQKTIKESRKKVT